MYDSKDDHEHVWNYSMQHSRRFSYNPCIPFLLVFCNSRTWTLLRAVTFPHPHPAGPLAARRWLRRRRERQHKNAWLKEYHRHWMIEKNPEHWQQ
jgi:hypothetical protein